MAETQQLKRAATRFYDTLNEALRTGRLDLLDDVLAPEAIDHNPVPGMAPGREEIKKAFAEGCRSFSDMRVTVDLKGSMELLADRDPEEARKILDPVLERMRGRRSTATREP